MCCSGAPAVLSLHLPEHTRATERLRAQTTRDVPSPATGPRWRRALGLQFLGPVQGSGLRDPSFLVRRIDDQVVQLSELLHLVVVHAEPPRTSAEVADAVSAAYGRTLTAEGVEHLVATRLEPLGLVVPDEAEEPMRPTRARPLLALTLKATLLPARSDASRRPRCSRRCGGRRSSWRLLVAMVIADIVLVAGGGFWRAVSEVFATPTTALLIYGLLVVSAVVHELGHAAACRYGGAEPGEIGVGVYLVFPAFYTDVTDSYRLGRGRPDAHRPRRALLQRADGPGAGAPAYVATGSGMLLLTALALQIQMLQQLIPVVRFDGYFILSDLAGVPDLFSRVGPVLRSLRPGPPRRSARDRAAPASRGGS